MATRAPTYMPPGAANDRRGAPRQQLHATRASVCSAGHDATEALLHDVSVYGCRLTLACGYRPGDQVTVDLGGKATVPAAVVWNVDGCLACRFDAPIPRTLMRALTLRLV